MSLVIGTDQRPKFVNAEGEKRRLTSGQQKIRI
jgi:hypothetical protein